KVERPGSRELQWKAVIGVELGVLGEAPGVLFAQNEVPEDARPAADPEPKPVWSEARESGLDDLEIERCPFCVPEEQEIPWRRVPDARGREDGPEGLHDHPQVARS